MPDTLYVVAPPSTRETLTPWMAAHRIRRPVVATDRLPAPAELRAAVAVFVVGERPAGLFLHDDQGRRVPLGGVRQVTPEFVRTAATVASRRGGAASAALLAQRSERALALAQEAAEMFRPQALFRWEADRLAYFRVREALATGLGALWYVGQGSALGWPAYGGIEAPGLCWQAPTAGVFSVTCASGQAGGFCEQLVENGFCAAAFGAAGLTSHQRNRRLCLALARSYAEQAEPWMGRVVAGAGTSWLSLAGYRLIGDPLAPLLEAEGASERAARVYAPNPNAAVDAATA